MKREGRKRKKEVFIWGTIEKERVASRRRNAAEGGRKKTLLPSSQKKNSFSCMERGPGTKKLQNGNATHPRGRKEKPKKTWISEEAGGRRSLPKKGNIKDGEKGLARRDPAT